MDEYRRFCAEYETENFAKYHIKRTAEGITSVLAPTPEPFLTFC